MNILLVFLAAQGAFAHSHGRFERNETKPFLAPKVPVLNLTRKTCNDTNLNRTVMVSRVPRTLLDDKALDCINATMKPSEKPEVRNITKSSQSVKPSEKPEVKPITKPSSSVKPSKKPEVKPSPKPSPTEKPSINPSKSQKQSRKLSGPMFST